MTVEVLDITGAWVFEPKQFADDRGIFLEWFQDSTFREFTGTDLTLKQANCSVSKRGVVRGLHFADTPPGQRKYVTCFSGAALDVVVDVRVGSPTFLKWQFVELNTNSRKVVAVPNGVAHGFLALEDNTTIVYLCDERYSPSTEREINLFDPEIGIEWPQDYEFAISPKDLSAPKISEVEFELPRFIS